MIWTQKHFAYAHNIHRLFGQHKICNYKKAVLSQRWPRDARYISRCEPLRRYGHSKLSRMAALNLSESKIAPLDPPSPKTPPYNQTWSGLDDRLRRYGHLTFFQYGGVKLSLVWMWTITTMLFYSVMQNSSKTWQRRWQKVDNVKTIIKFIDYVRSVLPSHEHKL